MNNSTEIEKENVITSFAWRGSASVIQFLLSLSVTLILMNYIGPDDYGLLAKVFIVLAVFNLFLDFGFSLAIVQQKELTRQNLSSHFIVSMLIAVFLATLMVLSRNKIAIFFEDERLSKILLYFSITLILGGSILIHRALHHRKMDFKKLAYIELSSLFLSALVGIYFAMKGYGYWAVVYQLVTLNVLQFFFFWSTDIFTPILFFKKSDILKTLNFSSYIFFINLLKYVSELLDQFMMTFSYSSATLGTYNRAISIVRNPVAIIPGTISQVLFPLFSKLENTTSSKKNKIENIYFRTSRILLFTFTPIFITAYIFGDDIISTIFREEWKLLIPYFRLLSLLSILLILNLEGTLLLAKGNTKSLFHITIPLQLITIISILIGINHGVETLIIYLIISEFINRVIMLLFLKYKIDLNLKEYFKYIVSVIIPITIITVTIFCISNVFNSSLYRFLALIITYIISMTLFIKYTRFGVCKELNKLIPW